MLLEDVVIVLSRPGESGNMGAVCRAMRNMGLLRLRIVSPPDDLDEAVIRARAVHGAALWTEAKRFSDLESAVADCSLVIGITRRMGRRRKAITMTPRETAVYLQTRPGPAALVFGNERTGLEGPELKLCSLASHIPADPVFPSLNLSHAVQIYAYELFSLLASSLSGPAGRSAAGRWIPLDRTALNRLVRSVTDSLESLGFYRQPGREAQEEFFRDIFSRAGLTLSEGRYMGDIFAKAARLGLREK
jgi:tRNA/rRNA methyltransferase/tRNA (cytidine32/uridine32-2'-O)-methyltransferase